MGSCWEGCCMLHQFQYPSWYLASLPVYIGLYHSTPNQLSFWRLFFIFSPFKVGLHFQVYLKDPFFLWSYSWSSTWPSVILSYSLVHNQGLGFEGQCPPPPFFFLILTSSPMLLPTPSLHPLWVEYQSWALSALRLVFLPHCALVTWHPDSISSGVFCVSPVYRRPCDLHLPLLCQTMSHSHGQLICTQRYCCGIESTRHSSL